MTMAETISDIDRSGNSNNGAVANYSTLCRQVDAPIRRRHRISNRNSFKGFDSR